MGFFEAITQVRALRAEGIDARAVECVRWDGKRYCVVFRNASELEAFREFNRDWDIKITELKG